MNRKFLPVGLLGLGLIIAGCANAAPGHSHSGQNTIQVARAVKAANASIAKMSGATTTKVSSAKEIANPYLADAKLKWPKTIVVVTYAGTFKAPTVCPKKKKTCPPIVFTTATVVVNPITDAILETVEPGWTTLPKPVVTPKVTPKPTATSKSTAKPKGVVKPKATATPKATASSTVSPSPSTKG